MSKFNKLTEGSLLKIQIKMTIPIICSLFVIFLNGFVDFAFIARLGGEGNITAFVFSSRITFIFYQIAFAFSLGGNIIISKFFAADNLEKVNENTLHIAIFCSSFIIILMCIFLCFYNIILNFIIHESYIINLMRNHLIFSFISIAFCSFYIVLGGAARACGNSKTHAFLMIIGAILNSIFSYIFIFGFYKIPAFGLTGAGAGTALSLFICFLLSIYIYFVRNFFSIKVKFIDFFSNCKKLFYVAYPLLFSNIYISISMVCLISIASTLGTIAVDSVGISTQIEVILSIVPIALQMSQVSIVGQNHALNKILRIRKSLRYTNMINFIFAIFCFFILFLLKDFLISFFSKKNGKLSEYITFAILFIPFNIFLIGGILNINAFFNGIMKPYIVAIINTLRYACSLIFVFIFIKYLYINGVFIGIFFANLFTFIISLIIFYIFWFKIYKSSV